MCFDPNIDLYSSFFLHIMLELKSIELVQWVLLKRISHMFGNLGTYLVHPALKPLQILMGFFMFIMHVQANRE